MPALIVIERGSSDWLESRDLKSNYSFDRIFFLVDILAPKGMLSWIVIGVIACAYSPRIKIGSKIELTLSEVPRFSNAFEEANDNWG